MDKVYPSWYGSGEIFIPVTGMGILMVRNFIGGYGSRVPIPDGYFYPLPSYLRPYLPLGFAQPFGIVVAFSCNMVTTIKHDKFKIPNSVLTRVH
uniref:Uncharacterized protein n=1 Tax=Oryza brachyantha TaxID=4533 RepID=J3N773_ORYBR